MPPFINAVLTRLPIRPAEVMESLVKISLARNQPCPFGSRDSPIQALALPPGHREKPVWNLKVRIQFYRWEIGFHTWGALLYVMLLLPPFFLISPAIDEPTGDGSDVIKGWIETDNAVKIMFPGAPHGTVYCDVIMKAPIIGMLC